MNNQRLTKLTLSILLLLGTIQTVEAKRYSKSDIDRMCSQNKSTPKKGIQFNGKRANKTILNLKAGKYTYPNGMLLLYSSGHYLLKVPRSNKGLHGTSANDLMGSNGILGGCSKEQLSEAIQSNGLSPYKFKLIKRYK